MPSFAEIHFRLLTDPAWSRAAGTSVPPYLVHSCPCDGTVPYRNPSGTQCGARRGRLRGSCGTLELQDILLRTDYSSEKRKVAPGPGYVQTVTDR